MTRTITRLTLTSVLLLGLAEGGHAAEEAPRPAPNQASPAANVAAMLDERSVLTPKGTLIIEPSLQYTHATATQVAIEGYTVIPSVLVGLINLSQVQRDTLTTSLALRYGLSKRSEVELRVPFVYREESVREREVFQGTPTDIVRDSHGGDLGDVEVAFRYQINASGSGPYWVANLRVKSRTGRDPFEADREMLVVPDGQGNQVVIGQVYTEQPTGSGFWSIQPSLSWIYPTDPAVLFGSISYMWNLERDVGGEFGKIDPGDAIGFNFGLGFAVNERTSFSLGYDHSIIRESRRDNDPGVDAVFDRFQVGTFLLGFSQRLGPKSSLNVSLGVGVTEFAPDVSLSLRLPFVL